MPCAIPPCTWPSTIIGLITLPTSSTAHVRADLRPPRLGVHLDRAQVGAVREGEVLRVEDRLGVDRRLHALGQVVRGEGRQRDLLDRLLRVRASPSPRTCRRRTRRRPRPPPAGARRPCGPSPPPSARPGAPRRRRRPASGSRRCPCPAARTGCRRRCTLDVLERDAERVGGDLAPRGHVALPVRGGAGDHLDLAGRQHPDAGRLPAAGAVGQRAEHPGRRQAAHLGVRRDADAELHRVLPLAPLGLLAAQLVVAEQLQRPGRRGLVVAAVVGQARRWWCTGTPACSIQFFRRSSIGSMPSSCASSVTIRSIAYVASGRPGAPVGVGRRLRGEDAGAAEPVARPSCRSRCT